MVFLPEATLILEETTVRDDDAPDTVAWSEVEALLAARLADADDAPTEEGASATLRDVDVYDSDLEETEPFIDASDPFYAFEAAEPYPISRSSPVSEVVSSGALPTPRTAFGR